MASQYLLGTIVYSAGTTAITASYPAAPITGGTVLGVGGTTSQVIWVKFVTDAATNFTSFNFEVADSFDGTAGSWLLNNFYRSDTASPPAITECVTNVVAGTTTWVKVQTTDLRGGLGGMTVFLKAAGGVAKAGDSATIFVVGI